MHRPWGIAYGIFLALAIIGGIYSITHRNPEYHKIDRAYMNNPHNCPLDGSNLLQKHHAEPGSGFNISDFMQHAGMRPLVMHPTAVPGCIALVAQACFAL
jgi:hypothetical protein